MSYVRRRLAALLIVMASLLLAAACVSVPTSGPIEKVEGQQPVCQNCVNVEVAFPAPGDEPKEIVEGYLRATSYYQPNYSVARQFLTRMAAEKWSPEDGASIYRGSLTATGDQAAKGGNTAKIKLGGQLVGSLGRDRTYSARNQSLNIVFGLVLENGEWRINDPPGGLMVEEVYFRSFYQPYDLYFVGNGRSLVPNPIYLPALNNPANVASALMKALLNGPSGWLKPAVSTAVPPNTGLSVDSVTITDGIAEVPLSDSVLALPDPRRSLLAAQIVYTLKQVGVKGVVIKVNQQPFRVPGIDPNNPVIAVEAIPRDLDPVPLVASEPLYAVQGRAVKAVTTTTVNPAVSDLPGPLGRGADQIDKLAVSVTNTDLAVTTNGGTTLRRAPITTGVPTTLPLGRVSDLLRPQFTRYGEIWDIGQQGGRQWMWVLPAGKKTPSRIGSEVLGKVTAFKISPDGTRIALVRSTGAGSELGLAKIIRSDKIMVDGWRALDTKQTAQPNSPMIDRIADVAWLDATELLVLGAAAGQTAYAPYRVMEDASRITPEGEVENGDAEELAVLTGTQTAIIVGGDGRTWKDDGNQWRLLPGKKTSAIAYPG